MTDYSTTKNRMEPGGDVWKVDGHIDRSGSPVLPLATLKAQLIQHYQVAPASASATAVHAAVTLGAAAQNITTAITNPDVPRNVTVKGNAAGITGDVVINGTNILDEEITETIALNAATEVVGNSAFKTVTSIQLPVKTNESGDTVSIGIGKKVGIPHIVYNASCLLVKLLDGSADSGSLTVDDDEVEKNVFAINGTPNGTRKLDLYYLM